MDFNEYPLYPSERIKLGRVEADLIWAGYDHIRLGCNLFININVPYIFPRRSLIPSDIPEGRYDARYLEMMRQFGRRMSLRIGRSGHLRMPALHLALADLCVGTTVTLAQHGTVRLSTHNFRSTVAKLRQKLQVAWRKLQRAAEKVPDNRARFKQDSCEWHSFARWFDHYYLDPLLRYGLIVAKDYPDDPVPWFFGVPDEPGTLEQSVIA